MARRDTYVRVTGRYAELLQGYIRVEDLTDEELARGQLRNKNGNFTGRQPKAIPSELVAAMRREWLSRAENTLRAALMEHGIGTLVELAKDKTIDPGVRLRAAEKIIERTMGKVPDRVHIAAEDPVEALFRSIMNDPEGLVSPGGPPIHEPSAEERALLM